jgi:hypothetical protein
LLFSSIGMKTSMADIAQDYDAAEDTRTVSELCDDLIVMAALKLIGPDGQTIHAAIRQLEHLRALRGEIDLLRFELAHIDTIHELDEANDPGEKGKIELVAAAAAVNEVRKFLSLIAPSHSLELLQRALADLVAGGTIAAMFSPLEETSNRRPDPPSVMSLKGALAGIMHCQQGAGMSREQAARLVARNISPKLVARISNRPISARTVEEWLDRFGGDHAENNAGRRSFLIWSRGEASSAIKIREITERMANDMPARKPR